MFAFRAAVGLGVKWLTRIEQRAESHFFSGNAADSPLQNAGGRAEGLTIPPLQHCVALLLRWHRHNVAQFNGYHVPGRRDVRRGEPPLSILCHTEGGILCRGDLRTIAIQNRKLDDHVFQFSPRCVGENASYAPFTRVTFDTGRS